MFYGMSTGFFPTLASAFSCGVGCEQEVPDSSFQTEVLMLNDFVCLLFQ